MPSVPPVFSDVHAILTKAIADWKAKHGRDPDLPGAHDTDSFSFETKGELLGIMAEGLPLIQPEVIGKTPKMGSQANIVIALQTGVNGFPQMPKGGPFVSASDIQVIIDWIDGNCQP